MQMASMGAAIMSSLKVRIFRFHANAPELCHFQNRIITIVILLFFLLFFTYSLFFARFNN